MFMCVCFFFECGCAMEKQCVFVCTQERNGKIAMDRGRRELFTKKKKKRVCEICACSSDSASHFVCCLCVCVCVCVLCSYWGRGLVLAFRSLVRCD